MTNVNLQISDILLGTKQYYYKKNCNYISEVNIDLVATSSVFEGKTAYAELVLKTTK